jgi:signal transduction histidine kinase
MFEPFVTTKRTGTGLGLAIARKVVEAHAGTIVARDAPGGGTTFAVTLPLTLKGAHR